jgi:predicted acetyltransferase
MSHVVSRQAVSSSDQSIMTSSKLAAPAPPRAVLRDDVIELQLLRVLGPDDAKRRPAEARFLAAAPECRFAIHRHADGERVGRIHLRLTDDPTIIRALGHSGYEVDEAHRRRGYAARALLAVWRLAQHYGVVPLWVLIAPDNVASRRTAERAGMTLVDTVAATPEALAMGVEPEVWRYAAIRP